MQGYRDGKTTPSFLPLCKTPLPGRLRVRLLESMMFVLLAEGKKDGTRVYRHSVAVAARWQEAAGEAGAMGTAFDLCTLPKGQQALLQ